MSWPTFDDDPAEYWRDWVAWARHVAVGLEVDPGLDPGELFDAIRERCDVLADENAASGMFDVYLALVGTATALGEQWAERP